MSRSLVKAQVQFDLPPGASTAEAEDYLEATIASYGGELRPPLAIDDNDDGDPFFSLDRDSIKIAAKIGRRSVSPRWSIRA